MEINTKTVTLRELKAGEGMVLTDVATETTRAKLILLGKDEDEHNYKEIDENTPLPEIEQVTEDKESEGIS